MKEYDLAIELTRELRRQYSRMLLEFLGGDEDYEVEDTIRIIGHLQATYDHLLASRTQTEPDLYCVLGKHLPTCLILAGEIGTEVGPIYNIMALLSGDKIKPCSACRKDRDAD